MKNVVDAGTVRAKDTERNGDDLTNTSKGSSERGEEEKQSDHPIRSAR